MLFAWITDLMLAGARYADAAGDCTWDRQHYFSFSGGSKTSYGATKPRTAAWVGGGDGYAPGAAGVNRPGHSAD